MMSLKFSLSFLLSFISIISFTTNAATVKRPRCSRYTLIDTRGTTEKQGPSDGFLIMNKNILSQISGGDEYDTVYPAGLLQDSYMGTQDIINKVTSLVNADPYHCIILEGYSQGATATVNAMPKLKGKYSDAVKGVFLIGNPLHKPNLACNVDPNGGTTTKSSNGVFYYGIGGIPDNWIKKTLDVCAKGDGVCSRETGILITPEHLSYPTSQPTQNLGTTFVINKLKGR